MEDKNKNVIKRTGPGLLGCLILLFAWAKIVGYISWSWWMVFVPLWGPIVAFLGIALVVFLGALLVAFAIDTYEKK